MNIKKSKDRESSKATSDMVDQRNLAVSQVEGAQNLPELNTPMSLEVCHVEENHAKDIPSCKRWKRRARGKGIQINNSIALGSANELMQK